MEEASLVTDMGLPMTCLGTYCVRCALAFLSWPLAGFRGLISFLLLPRHSVGWVHNRIRVVVASFLVKNLLLPWQWGLKHFWDALIDADLESDALGWQYVSGCLVDAHPFDYIMDLTKESQRFDPEGNYVRRWLPSLARLPKQWIQR